MTKSKGISEKRVTDGSRTAGLAEVQDEVEDLSWPNEFGSLEDYARFASFRTAILGSLNLMHLDDEILHAYRFEECLITGPESMHLLTEFQVLSC